MGGQVMPNSPELHSAARGARQRGSATAARLTTEAPPRSSLASPPAPAGLLFFSTYTLLVLFWAEIYYQARSLPTGSLRPAFVVMNLTVYAIQVTRCTNSQEGWGRCPLPLLWLRLWMCA